MSCEACNEIQEKGITAYFRWGIAEIEVSACPKHLEEVFRALRNAQRIQPDKDFFDQKTPTIEEKQNCFISAGVGPGEHFTLIATGMPLRSPLRISRLEGYKLRDQLCAFLGTPNDADLNYLG